METFHFLLIYSALLIMYSDGKPWPGKVLKDTRPHVYETDIYRDKRQNNDDLLYDDGDDNNPEMSRYDPGDGNSQIDYYSNHDTVEDKNLRKAFNNWFKVAQQEKMARIMDPFHLDMYRIQMSKPPIPNRRRVVLPDRSDVRRKLSRIQSLQDRLRHIEEMKAALQEKITELQRIKEKERNAQIRIENEVSKAERDWKEDVDRFKPSPYKPSGYKPLVRLGDASRLL